MSIDELRDALTILAQDDPDFLKKLIGEVIKENLCINNVSDGDYYNPGTNTVLEWKETPYDYKEFSRAY